MWIANMRRTLALLALLFTASLAFAGTGTQYSGITSVTYQNGLDGYTGTTDTYIAEIDSTLNFGGCDTLKVSYATWTGYQSGNKKTLIKFDISDLPDSAVITQAYLQLYQYSNNAGANQDTLFLRRLVNAPDMGSGACTGTTGSNAATWKDRDGGTAWISLGASSLSSTKAWYTTDSTLAGSYLGTDTMSVGSGIDAALDFESSTIAKAGVGANNRYGWVVFNVAHQVRLWHIGANDNNGFIIATHNTGVDKDIQFYSSDYVGYTYRPKLIIQYFDPTSGGGGSSAASTIIGHDGSVH